MRVADVASVRPGLRASARQGALNRGAAKHFDFIVCRAADLGVVAAIEFNDRSHATPRAQARDELLARVCEAIGLPPLTFEAKAGYVPDEVRSRVVAAISR